MAEYTRGPWAWYGNTKHNYYLATNHSGRLHVMGFRRKGLNGAQPIFRTADGMRSADEVPVFEVARDAIKADDPSVYRHDIVGFRSADATLIAASPELADALRDLLPVVGYSNMTDDELRHEAELGNGAAPKILAARAALKKAGVNG